MLMNIAKLAGAAVVEFGAAQNAKELVSLGKLLSGRKLQNVAEIGTKYGGTLFFWCSIAQENAALFSIDLPAEKLGPVARANKAIDEEKLRGFLRGGQVLHCIRGNSHSARTALRTEKLLAGRKLDFLFIDGDHSFPSVKRDFELYQPLVGKGGIVAFHDIAGGSCGVPFFWDELKKSGRYSFVEILHDPQRGGHGIGVLFV